MSDLIIDKPGAYRISNEEYHRDPCVSPSLSRGVCMDLLFQSCARAAYNHPRLNPAYVPANDSKFSIGSAAHSLFLEGNDIVSIVFADDWRTKAAKEKRDEAWEAGKVPMLEKEYYTVSEMTIAAKVALMDSELGLRIEDGDSELSYFWEEDGTWFRTRPDWLSKDRHICLDYKTSAQSVNPAEVSGKILNMGYDVQDALYSRSIKAVEGVDTKFVFMFQEIEKPYLCSFVSLPPAFKDIGQRKVSHAVGLWNQCMTTGEWPGYPSKICYPDVPPWAENWMMKANFIGEDTDELQL
jgi:hypothetical protein